MIALALSACTPGTVAPPAPPADPPEDTAAPTDPAIGVDPPSVVQGHRLAFAIDGLDAEAIPTSVRFVDAYGSDIGVEVAGLGLDGDVVTGHLSTWNATVPGVRDVVVTWDDRQVVLDDAFAVIDAPTDLSDIYVSTRFDVARTIDPDTGAVAEQVTAEVRFLVPLDPPCSAPDRCPELEGVSAGPQVWFVGPNNVVTLDRVVDVRTGWVRYEGRGLTLADYRFGTLYDLEGPGDPEGLPPFYVSDVQPTVPADYALVSPSFVDLVVARDDGLAYTWGAAEHAGAMTYPDAIFGVAVAGGPVVDGEPTVANRMPWDDGSDVYTAAELYALEPGPARFDAFAYIEGPYFGLPMSSFQWCQSDSTLSTTAYLTLE